MIRVIEAESLEIIARKHHVAGQRMHLGKKIKQVVVLLGALHNVNKILRDRSRRETIILVQGIDVKSCLEKLRAANVCADQSLGLEVSATVQFFDGGPSHFFPLALAGIISKFIHFGGFFIAKRKSAHKLVISIPLFFNGFQPVHVAR